MLGLLYAHLVRMTDSPVAPPPRRSLPSWAGLLAALGIVVVGLVLAFVAVSPHF